MRRSFGSGQRYSRTWLSEPILIVCAVMVLGLVAWQPTLRAISNYLVVDETLRAADAVVVLSGDYALKRLNAGLTIVRQGIADWMIVLIDLPADSPEAAVVRRDAERAGVDARRVIVVGNVHSTADDAVRAADIMSRRGWRTAVVVTSPYHTRRASVTFRRVWKPLGLSASLHPSEDAVFDAGPWWQGSRGLQTITLEYAKLAAYVVWFTLLR